MPGENEPFTRSECFQLLAFQEHDFPTLRAKELC